LVLQWVVVREEEMHRSELFYKKCPFCGEEYDEEDFQECLSCGEEVCPNCVDVDSYGDNVCPACFGEEIDEF